MTEKKPCIVITFFTTAEAMATKNACEMAQIAGRLFSTPRSLSADCGIAWQSPLTEKEKLITCLEENGIEFDLSVCMDA